MYTSIIIQFVAGPGDLFTKLPESSYISAVSRGTSGRSLAKSYHLSNNGRGTRTCDRVRGQGCPRLGLRVAIQIAKLGE